MLDLKTLKVSSCAKNGQCKPQVCILTGHSDTPNLQFLVCSKINSIFKDKDNMKHQCHSKTPIPPGASEEALPFGEVGAVHKDNQ